MRLRLLTLCILSTPLYGAAIATYDFNGLVGDEASLASASTVTNITAGSITRGAAYGSVVTQAFTTNGLAVNPGASLNSNSPPDPRNTTFDAAGYTSAAAYNNGGYWELTITPTSGHQVSIDGITLGTRYASNSTGSRFIATRTSADGFASEVTWNVSGAGAGGNVSSSLFLDFGTDVQNISSTVTIRLIGWWRQDTSTNYGLWTISNPNASDLDGAGSGHFTVEGSVSPIPEMQSFPIILSLFAGLVVLGRRRRR